jgi:hypothetical protein
MTFKSAIGNRKSTMRRAVRPLRHTSPQGRHSGKRPGLRVEVGEPCLQEVWAHDLQIGNWKSKIDNGEGLPAPPPHVPLRPS